MAASSRRRFAVLVLLLGALAGCRRDTREGATTDPSARPATSAIAATSASAAPSAVASASASAGASPARRSEPNLLEIVPSKVAVSSAVHNPRDFPEHLVDGHSETAWNGKTGELVGGWIAFRVPKDARVKRIEMTAGFDKTSGALDLFTANHRITKVAVKRDDKPIGEFPLDPKVRGLQSIPIDADGGEYVITVRETLPGTKKEWKELVVSELRVVGTPGKERRGPKDPLRVTVGSLDAEASPTLTDRYDITTSFKTIAELCAAYLKSVDAEKAVYVEAAKENGITLDPPSCKEVPFTTPFKSDATYKSLHAVYEDNGYSHATHLVVEGPRGFVPMSVSWAHYHPMDPGCPSTVRARGVGSARIENGYLVIVQSGWNEIYDPEGRYVNAGRDGATWCKEAGGKLTCQEYSAQLNGDIGDFSIAPDGTLRLQGER